MTSKTGAAYVSRLQTAITKLGTNGTKIPDGTPPADITSNEEVSLWHDKHKAVSEYLVASTIKRVAEAREKNAKARVETLFNLADAKRTPGTGDTYVFDNVALNIKITNPRMLLDRSKLLTALTKHGLTAEQTAKIIADSESESAPPRTLSATTTAE
jgi:hypothetical protein